ncbi:MAG: hypothetical protein QN163_07305 [Armatimonadota bacterium]|nr:hypothetical protein [Armatimonadota bacterium]
MTGAVPDLRFVPVGRVLLHEECDPERVERLARRLQWEGVLKNPPVAALTDEGRAVVLDGANRTSALIALGVPHVLVQVVEYEDPAVCLSTWRHLLTEPLPDAARRFEDALGMPLAWTTPEAAADRLDKRDILAYVAIGGRALEVPRAATLEQDADRLARLVGVYRGVARIHRVTAADPQALAAEYGSVGLLVAFPPFDKTEIIRIAQDNAKLPTGITRHVIPGRALRVNLPLGRLTDPEPAEAKTAWMHGWIGAQLLEGRVRYYAEPTFLFDE